MRVAQVAKAKGPIEIVERPKPEAGPGQVRIKVQACGICHSDSVVKDGLFPNIPYPRVPGHEVAGVIDSLGSGVTQLKAGERVGVGWHGGYCGVCDPCRHGDFFACVLGLVTGISHDGGYGEYMIAPANSVARLPDELSPIEAAPLDVRRHHNVQCTAQQRGATRRSCRGAWARWPGAFGSAVRREDGFSHRRHRAR